MNVMVKRGSLDNVVTFQHFCDTIEDLSNIPANQITLGSVAIILGEEGEDLQIYIANSEKEWLSIGGNGGGGGSSGATFIPSISNTGVISWTNDGELENPEPVDMVSLIIAALPSAVGVEF